MANIFLNFLFNTIDFKKKDEELLSDGYPSKLITEFREIQNIRTKLKEKINSLNDLIKPEEYSEILYNIIENSKSESAEMKSDFENFIESQFTKIIDLRSLNLNSQTTLLENVKSLFSSNGYSIIFISADHGYLTSGSNEVIDFIKIIHNYNENLVCLDNGYEVKFREDDLLLLAKNLENKNTPSIIFIDEKPCLYGNMIEFSAIKMMRLKNVKFIFY